MTDHEHTNRLIDETSPYLLQHAHNPVDWYPWGDEALEKARRQDKPIFLSIGYSACHWCHVMERESFEDEAIAEYLNEHFVPIKVDREERPDIDRVYMNATQLMTGQGGWPMSVFLTPDLEPFYAGTYFPPEDKYGRPGFGTVLERLVGIWEDERDRAESIGERMRQRLEQASEKTESSDLNREPLRKAIEVAEKQFDRSHGGFGGAPKFPSAMTLRTLMHGWADGGLDQETRNHTLGMVETTLAFMASGGMYDQIGGGFHRYSTDQRWLVPHFEKMLYDNALLTSAYTDAWRITGRDFYERVVDETIEYVRREMTLDHDAGAPFFSTQDADSEGEEGKFFVWTPDQVADILGDERGAEACEWWDITEGGNWEGTSIPNRLNPLEQDGVEAAFDARPDHIEEMREDLFEARTDRVAPATDTKVLASWNGLMIAAMAHAGDTFGREDWIDAARRAATFVTDVMIDGERDEDFEVMRTYKDGRARITGYLDDYAYLANGLLELFEASGEPQWLRWAERILERADDLFGAEGAYFYTGQHHDNVLVRDKDQIDNATPAGNSQAVKALVKLGRLTGDSRWEERADAILSEFGDALQKRPHAMGEMLQGLDLLLSESQEIVSVDPGDACAELDDVLRRRYLPHAVRVRADLDEMSAEDWAELTPLMEGRDARDGRCTVYVCQNRACRRPVTEPEDLEEMLDDLA